MVEERKGAADKPLDVVDRKMLAEIKANVLGTQQPHELVGRFRVLRQLGSGSMGVVLEAFDDRLDRRVALKLLHRDVGTTEERKLRMLREAQAAARLTHPNVVHVHEVGEHDGHVFMAMELVEGQSLYELQRSDSPGDWSVLLELYLAAGRGLAAAHAKGVVHRDFKPHNVLVDAERRVRVVDFGLARGVLSLEQQHTDEIPISDNGAVERARLERLTATGANPGTPAYMAPELFDGATATRLSDQFSFCVALYEAVYGRRPFSGDRLHEIVAAAKQGRVCAPPPDRNAPRWLFKVVARGLAPNPAERFPDMETLLDELGRDRGRRRRIGGSLAVVGFVGTAAWWGGLQMDTDAAVNRESVASVRAAAVETQRRRACTAQTDELRAHWREAEEQLRERSADRDAEGLAAALQAGARRYFERWESTCRQDVEGATASCRRRSRIEFESMLAVADERGRLHEDGFHDRMYELELCLEAGTSSCRSAEIGAAAAAALEAARAAELAGDLDAALELAEEAVRLADGRSDALTGLRASLRRASIHEARGEIDAARAVLDRTLVSALVCGADVLAIDVALEQVEAEALHSGDVERAKFAVSTAADLLDGNGSGLRLRRARLLEKDAGARIYLEHRCAEGVDLLEQSLEIRERVIAERRHDGLSTAHFERLAADAQLNMTNARYYALAGYWETCALGDVEPTQLFEDYRRARERFAGAVGRKEHLGLAEYDYSYGAALLNLGRAAEAIGAFESVLAIYEVHHGPRSLPVGDARIALAEAHRQTGALEQARRHAKANLEIRLRRRGEEGQRLTLAEAYHVLAAIAHERKDLTEARSALLDAVSVLSRPPSSEMPLKEHEQLRMTYANLALLDWDRGDRDAAKRGLGKAGELRKKLDDRAGVRHPDLPQERLVQAHVWIAAGNRERALEALKGAELLPDSNAAVAERIAALRRHAQR